MKFNQAFPSPYVKASDFDGEEPVLTIKKVSSEAMNDGGERRCLEFHESEKRLLLNRTNWAKVSELTGQADDSNWAGHKIRLVKTQVAYKGDLVPAIRIDAADRPF
jgi:hypothetical protein